jgi:hypothetical protein
VRHELDHFLTRKKSRLFRARLLDASNNELHINVWKNKLGSTPDWLWERDTVETLVLADNALTEIPDLIGPVEAAPNA